MKSRGHLKWKTGQVNTDGENGSSRDKLLEEQTEDGQQEGLDGDLSKGADGVREDHEHAGQMTS